MPVLNDILGQTWNKSLGPRGTELISRLVGAGVGGGVAATAGGIGGSLALDAVVPGAGIAASSLASLLGALGLTPAGSIIGARTGGALGGGAAALGKGIGDMLTSDAIAAPSLGAGITSAIAAGSMLHPMLTGPGMVAGRLGSAVTGALGEGLGQALGRPEFTGAVTKAAHIKLANIVGDLTGKNWNTLPGARGTELMSRLYGAGAGSLAGGIAGGAISNAMLPPELAAMSAPVMATGSITGSTIGAGLGSRLSGLLAAIEAKIKQKLGGAVTGNDASIASSALGSMLANSAIYGRSIINPKVLADGAGTALRSELGEIIGQNLDPAVFRAAI